MALKLEKPTQEMSGAALEHQARMLLDMQKSATGAVLLASASMSLLVADL